MKHLVGIILLFAFSMLNGQAPFKDAEKAFQKKEFVKAIPLYKEAIGLTTNKIKRQVIFYKLAQCHHLLYEYDDAIINYENSIYEGNEDPELQLRLGMALMNTGAYRDAKKCIRLYLKAYPDDQQAKNLSRSCNFALKYKEVSPFIRVVNEQGLNSADAEYGIGLVDGYIVYSSSRKDIINKNTYKVTGQNYTSFYRTKQNPVSNDWIKPEKVNWEINSNFNEGTFAFNTNSNILYYMQCNGKKGKENNCAIFFAQKEPNTGKWSDPQRLNIGSEKYNYGHPTLTPDGNTLFFSSDLPDGEGGKDIWFVELDEDGQSTNLQNAGYRVNSENDEVFPYIFNDSILYFSSNGHSGYGGLDIFQIDITKRERPTNLKQPINSSYDDFGIIAFSTDSGMFVSNRPGGIGDDDIYSFSRFKQKVNVSGAITEMGNRKLIDDAIVYLSSQSGVLDSFRTDNNGLFNFENIDIETVFAISVYKKGYLNNIRFISDKLRLHSMKTKKLYTNIELLKFSDQEIKINNIYYDFGKWNLTPDSKDELIKLVTLLKINPEIDIQINAHTDDIGDDNFNFELSNYRAQSVVNYLIESGIDLERLTYRGWGETKPFVKNAESEEEKQLNRRTTFQIINTEDLALEKTTQDANTLTQNMINQQTAENEKEENEEISDVVFKLQVYAGDKKIPKDLKDALEKIIGRYEMQAIKSRDGINRYTVGDFLSFEQAMILKDRLAENNYNAIILAFKNGLRVTIIEARQMLER